MPDRWAITNVHVVEVATGRLRRDSSVVIDGPDIADVVGPPPPASVPALDGGAGYLAPGLIDGHVHFFFDTVEPRTNAGTGGPNPGFWIIYDTPSPFTLMKLSDKPAGAKQMCILVADQSHAIEVGTGNCVDLPAG